MTTEVSADANNEASNVQPTSPFKTVEEALSEIEKLKSINKEVISSRDQLKTRLRGFEDEQTQREQALLAEQGKYKELYEKRESEFSALKNTLKTKAVDSALREILQKAGARSVDTVAKLVDKSKVTVNEEDFSVNSADIEAQIEELKKTDSILFGIVEGANLPPVKRASSGEPQAGYEQEMRACKTPAEIQNVLRKYGKI